MSYRVGFLMDQIAGHVTNYRNLRRVAGNVPELDAAWHELHYYKSGGTIERVRERVPFLSSYATGIARGALEMRRALRSSSYDALFSNASVGVFFSRTFRRVPTLIDFDSTPLQIDRMTAYATSAPDPRPIAYLKWRLFRDMLHSATLLQAWSQWAKQSAVEEYGVPAAKIVVNPPGVDLDLWRPATTNNDRCTDEPLKVLFVGADFRRKGGNLLLEWYKSQPPDACELHIVTRESVENMPGLHVYHNIQPNSAQLIGLYQNSDLFVLPSLGECFGIATIEAMATGLPVIASDVGGVADIIEPGRNGFIVPSNDVAALAQAIGTILGAAAQRRAMGRQSRLLAEERFDVRKNALRTFDYLKQIAKRPQLHGLPTSVERGL